MLDTTTEDEFSVLNFQDQSLVKKSSVSSERNFGVGDSYNEEMSLEVEEIDLDENSSIIKESPNIDLTKIKCDVSIAS